MPGSLVHYDTVRRRLWILGRRCHRGATGVVLTGTAATGLAARAVSTSGSVALVAAGSALMAPTGTTGRCGSPRVTRTSRGRGSLTDREQRLEVVARVDL